MILADSGPWIATEISDIETTDGVSTCSRPSITGTSRTSGRDMRTT